MELEQYEVALQKQKEEIIELRKKMEELEIKITQIAAEMRTKSRRTKKATDEQPNTTTTSSPATKLLDTFKFEKKGLCWRNIDVIFHKLQLYICMPQRFDEGAYQSISGHYYDMSHYDDAKQAIIELSVNPYMTLQQFKKQLTEDKKYVQIDCGTPRYPKPCIVRRF